MHFLCFFFSFRDLFPDYSFSILFLMTVIYKSNTECNQFYQYAIHSATIEVMTSSRLLRLHYCIDTATKLLISPPMDEIDDAFSRTFFDLRFKSKSRTSHVLVMECNVGCCMWQLIWILITNQQQTAKWRIQVSVLLYLCFGK